MLFRRARGKASWPRRQVRRRVFSNDDIGKHGFGTPEAVVEDPDLTTVQKRALLSSWEYDCRALEVAEEENMQGGEGSLLQRVLEALRRLGHDAGASASPTKHGGRG